MITLREKTFGKSYCTIEPMTMAILGAGAMSAGSSIFSGIFGAKGADKQADAIRYGADVASRTALELNNRARADLAPFRQYGIDAGDTLTNLLFGGGDVSAATKASPLFQFQSELGMRNINRELAARGLFNSGAGLETLQRFNNQLVGEEADRLYARLFNLTQLGENAAAQTASNTTATARQVSAIQANAGVAEGNAIASGYNAIGRAGAGAFDAFGGGLQSYAQYQMYQPLIAKLTGGGNVMGYSRPDMSFNPATAGQDVSLTG